MSRTPIPASYIRNALSIRELEIIRASASGSPSREFAETLWVAEQTVKFHLSNIYRKLGVSNRTAAVWRCMQLGLIDPPPVAVEPVSVCPACGREHT